jgi:hypothetical protein
MESVRRGCHRVENRRRINAYTHAKIVASSLMPIGS